MPAPTLALLTTLMLAQGAVPADPLVHKVREVKCRLAVNDVCQDNLPGGGAGLPKVAGNGGAGGNATVNYYFVLGGSPVAGNGGAGGSVKGGGVPVPGGVVPQAMPAPPGPPVSLTLSRCKLTIAGKTEVDAKACQYEKVAKEFKVTAPSENKKYTYTIKVALNEDKTGVGTLSGGKTSAVRPLGKLVRNRACWVSEDASVEICAWK